jgi:hypothetical protein
MTRYLSQALGAEEPRFSQSISALEQASGHPSADIRLSSDLMQRARAKIAQLGLDPKDTTGDELYSALHERLKQDDALVHEVLHITSDASSSEVVAQVCQFLKKLDTPKNCFVLKTSVARRLLKQRPPKAAMKQLGYRSVDSLLKRESPALVYAAALIAESPQWHKRYRELYGKLRPGDFETRSMDFFYPNTKRWLDFSKAFVARRHQNILCFKELGDLVLLPIEEQIDGLAITTFVLALEYMNDIRAQSSYTKLQQVKSDFGRIMQQSSVAEPYTSAVLAGQPISWRMIQRYYGHSHPDYHAEVFEPHVQPEDLQWHNAEDILSKLAPAFAFWQDTQCLYILENGSPVSMNILDVALSYCNHLPFAERVVQFVRNNLWHELMLRYLDQRNLEDALHRQLSAELAPEMIPELADA